LIQNAPYTFHTKSEIQDCCLVVCWYDDPAKLGRRIIDYLNCKLDNQLYCEIEPEDFFRLGGVSVEDNVARLPESKFYYYPGKKLIILGSNSPRSEWYKFLNTIMDIAIESCQIKEIYTIGTMVTLAAHTVPRLLLSTFNLSDIKARLSHYDLIRDVNYETPPGQRPTISSYLLWVALARSISAASFWVPVPFYLLTTEDPRALRKVVEFLNQRFCLGIDLSDIDEAIHRQNIKIAEVANKFPEMDSYFRKLESNIELSDEENNRLVQIMEENLRQEV
jgi:proteasome assembly chaperone (PAC2) family protein